MSDIIKAKRYAVGLLSRRMYTSCEIFDKLIKKGFSDEISRSVVDEFSDLKYINDEEYARLYFTDNINVKAKGVYRISRELAQKGISRDIIQDVSAEFEDNVYSKLKEYVKFKTYGSLPTDFKEVEKLKAHLIRRGYSISDINRVLSELKDEN